MVRLKRALIPMLQTGKPIAGGVRGSVPVKRQTYTGTELPNFLKPAVASCPRRGCRARACAVGRGGSRSRSCDAFRKIMVDG
jgi:hypothetical protein